LAKVFEFYASYPIVPFDEMAARRFEEFRKAKIRVGTSDLKIAAVAITCDSLLLTANRHDFELVPGLRFENWLDDS
jgi:tRNA(fMet)-specific endonuclease VapC